jgi:hypothetical protein
MNGFFEHFRVTFDGPGQYCELERLYKPNFFPCCTTTPLVLNPMLRAVLTLQNL